MMVYSAPAGTLLQFVYFNNGERMAHVTCQCGTEIAVPETLYGQAAHCESCRSDMRFVVPAREAAGAISAADEFGACLVIEGGPDGIGEQLFLADGGPIAIGKLPQLPICLTAPLVSRHHCTLVPSETGRWRVEDHRSRNGIYVNGERMQARELRDGDLLEVGEYHLRYHAAGDVDLPALEAAPVQSELGFADHAEPEAIQEQPPEDQG
jgi:hypothetical protein